MTAPSSREEGAENTWDEEHVKALLNFPRYPLRLIQVEPWQSWISRRGGLKAVYDFLRNYSFPPSHHRILEVVLSNPEEVSDVYADQLNISRATYFYRLRELVPAVVHELNQWQLGPLAPPLNPPSQVLPLSLLPRLPTPLTGLVGADDILQSLHRLLLRDDIRLLTLLGPGGVGKTRLSIELANQVRGLFADQVAFIDISPVGSPSDILPSIADALGLSQSGEASLQAFLMPRKFLLVLDNFEHLLAGAPIVSELLTLSSGLKVVVTSRAALRLYGEHEFTVSPLPSPSLNNLAALDDAATSPAVALFAQRAQAVNPTFSLTQANIEAVAELCLRMDGIPLAIELAAYQAKYYSPQAMLVRLSNSKCLNFLNQGPKRLHARQQTPRDILDWSYQLLSIELQVLFNRLAVFAGGCTIEAADAVCGDVSLPAGMGLAALADQSLLQQHIQSDGEPRYLMLGITREYGLEQLDSRGETAAYERSHADYYLRLAETPSQPHEAWIETIEREQANLGAAVQWYLANDQGEGALRLAAALSDWWRFSGTQQEGYPLMQSVLEQTPSVDLPIRADVLQITGWLAHQRGDLTTMKWAFQSMHDLAVLLEDQRDSGRAEIGLAEIARWQSRWEEGTGYIDHALTLLQAADDRRQVGWVLIGRGRIAFSQGDLDSAAAQFQESTALFEGVDAHTAKADALCHHGLALFYAGLLDQAALRFEACVYLKESSEDVYSEMLALAQVYLAQIDIYQGRFETASLSLETGMALSQQQGYLGCIETAHHAAALLAIQQGDTAQARRSLRESLLIQESLKEGWRALALVETVARLMLSLHEPLSAARLLGAVDRLREIMQIARFPLDVPLVEATVNQLRDQLDPITLEDAWSAGQGLSLEQMLIYALRCLE